MPRTYKLRVGEVGGNTYKPKKREKKREIPNSQEVRSIIEESVLESTQKASQCAASLPGIISSQVMVPAELSGAAVDTHNVEETQMEEEEDVQSSQTVHDNSIEEIDLVSEYQNQCIAPVDGRTRTRNFFVTINRGSKEMLNILKREGLESDFIIIGGVENAPTTGHEHYHAVIHYKNQHSLHNLIKKIKGYGKVQPIINYQNGTADTESLIKCVRYVQKKFQVIYQQGNLPNQGKRNDLDAMLRECKTREEFMSKYPSVWIRYHNGIKDYYEQKQSFQNFSDVYDDVKSGKIHERSVKIIFITGFSGTGKSSFGWNIAVNYLKIPKEQLGTIKYGGNGTFNNGYNYQAPYLIWNEFRDSQLTYDEFIHLCDKYGNDCNVKYGKSYLRPKMIIIDSVQALETIFPDEEDINRYQVYRRIFKYLEMDEDHSVKEIDLKPLMDKLKGKPRDDEVFKRRQEFEKLQKTRTYKPFDPKSLLDDFNLYDDITLKKLPNSMSLDKIDDNVVNSILSQLDDQSESVPSSQQPEEKENTN